MPVSTIKEQTAFRFEPELLARMKKAAKMRKKSLNQYVTEIIEKDLELSSVFPAVVLTSEQIEFAARFAGKMSIPSREELSSDERLSRIWTR